MQRWTSAGANALRVLGRAQGLGWFAVWLLAGGASPAHAQISEPWPDARHFELLGDLGYFHTSPPGDTLDVFALRVDGMYAIDESFSVSGRLGITTATSSPDAGDGDTVLCFGNPAVLGYYQSQWRGVHFRVGVGGAGPLAVADAGDLGRLRGAAYKRSQAMSGLWDLWLWAPSRGTLMVDGRATMRVLDRTWLDLEVEPQVFIPARRLFLREHVELVIPTAATIGPRYLWVWVGMRFQAVFMPTNDADTLQLALGPWLHVPLPEGFVEVSYIGNVFEPVAGRRGPGGWGMHVTGGGTW